MSKTIGPLNPVTFEDGFRIWTSEDGEWSFYDDDLMEWFDIDPNLPLDIVLYEKPGKDRLEVVWGEQVANQVAVVDRQGSVDRIEVPPGWVNPPPMAYPYYMAIRQ